MLTDVIFSRPHKPITTAIISRVRKELINFAWLVYIRRFYSLLIELTLFTCPSFDFSTRLAALFMCWRSWERERAPGNRVIHDPFLFATSFAVYRHPTFFNWCFQPNLIKSKENVALNYARPRNYIDRLMRCRSQCHYGAITTQFTLSHRTQLFDKKENKINCCCSWDDL